MYKYACLRGCSLPTNYLRIRPDILPLPGMAFRACSKAVGVMCARGAGPSTSSLDQQREIPPLSRASGRITTPPFTPVLSESHQVNHRHAATVSAVAIVLVHQHSLFHSARAYEEEHNELVDKCFAGFHCQCARAKTSGNESCLEAISIFGGIRRHLEHPAPAA